ncbi:MAG: hypothetical protein MKZ95_06665, partial [Pirellulales bacterium]|nr:hypothetical protein [Pirellulales bacterium]
QGGPSDERLLPGRVWAVPGRPRRHALVLALAFLHVFQARSAASSSALEAGSVANLTRGNFALFTRL